MAIERGLTVCQLIEELKGFSPELKIVVDGYEGGTDSLVKSNILLKYIDKNATMGDYHGEHGDHELLPDGMANPVMVIVLGRKHWRGGDTD